MLRRPAGGIAGDRSWLLIAGGSLATLAVIGALAIFVSDRVNALSAILAVAAVLAGFLVAGEQETFSVSSSFIVAVIAATFLGPASAVLAAVISELSATIRFKTRLRSLVLMNLPAAVAAAATTGLLLRAVASPPGDRAGFYLAVMFVAAGGFVLAFAIFALLHRLVWPDEVQFGLRSLVENLPSVILSTAVVVAGVSIQLKIGNSGIAFALAGVFAFSYMAHLLAQSRRRAEQYVSLSWGVLAGLMRSLDIRDGRAARHSAAVARFARDMAEAVGMSVAEQELAHTAGLLHDIGHFALSDRVAERGRILTNEDWEAIQRHPELGADMLRDLGMYGPVAEIVLCHHERIDGMGYPQGLLGDEIPEIAKIISVAEVYDTLTASDTYRTRMSSFEALRELRRVAGSQLDERYVEVLASLLSGEGVEYRHADAADFDTELDMQRRIREAGTG
jgi:putative nucleotidyltransferase with HDIG domain